jgi:tetratricopeptide (TPR) repeat protein
MIEKAEAIYKSCDRDMRKTSILMGLGREDDAFNFINACIQHSPMFGGYRYYQRGLIEYDRGDLGSASDDLEMGEENTSESYSLHEYLAGLLALKAGNKDEGIQDLQSAYSTWESTDGLWLSIRIKKDLAAAGGRLPSPEPAVTLNATPIP